MPKMQHLKLSLILLLFVTQFACQRAKPTYNPTKSTITENAMVVSPHPLASDIGVEILKKGGNAVDAAIAVQFAIAVCYPRAGNLGGGGFMVIRTKDGMIDALDYREKAPASAHRDMYLDSLGNVIEGISTEGHKASGVPGTVAGLFEAHKKYGKLPMDELIRPAIRLAERGYVVTATEAERFNRYQESFRKYNTSPSPFLKERWVEGDDLVQRELAQTLERIRTGSTKGFYEGETADQIVEEMQSGGGLITHEDLKNYRATWRKPIVGDYKGYRVISMPPSSSGGVALLQMLGMVENYDLGSMGFHSADAVHLMVEAERRAYADRAQHLGDSDFYEVPIDSLISEAYLQHRMSDFSPTQASLSDSILAGNFNLVKESFETTHTSVIDAEGNSVSVTTTLNSNFGSKVWVDGAGFFLNNEMDDFSIRPGVLNQFGLTGGEANKVEPNKRMVSSMTPTIILKDSKPYLIVGSPGGSTIMTVVLQVVMNVLDFNMNIQQANDAPRIHHQWLPDRIDYEQFGLPEDVKLNLIQRGHNIGIERVLGRMDAIMVNPSTGFYYGATDKRGYGAAVGY